MRRSLTLAVALAAAVFCNACFPKIVKVAPQIRADNDAVTRPTLREYIGRVGDPVVVLRVPVTTGDLTQTIQSEVDKRNAAYGEIERELVRAGFTVRDRALLNRVLSENSTLSYSEIKERIQTDLIIELVRFEAIDMSNREFQVFNKKTGENGPARTLPYLSFQMTGVAIEARVVIVETGAIGGIYALTIPPCDPCTFSWDQNNNFIYTSDINGVLYSPLSSAYGVNYKNAAQRFGEHLVAQLRSNK